MLIRVVVFLFVKVDRGNYILIEMMKLFIAITLSIVSYACGDSDYYDPMDEELYQGIRFEYNEESNQTNVGVVFRLETKEGEKIRLSPPAHLLINEEILNDYDGTLEYPYSVSFESRLPEAVIDFVDFKKQMFAHKVRLDSLVNVGELYIDSDREDKSFSVLFTGEKRCEGETITLVISCNDSEFRYDVQPENDNSITLDSGIISLFSGKEVGIKIVRVKNIKLQNVSSAGGDLQLVYVSQEKHIQI